MFSQVRERRSSSGREERKRKTDIKRVEYFMFSHGRKRGKKENIRTYTAGQVLKAETVGREEKRRRNAERGTHKREMSLKGRKRSNMRHDKTEKAKKGHFHL